MGKKKKHKIRQLDSCPYTKGVKKIELEPDSQKLFEEYLDKTDWNQVREERSQEDLPAFRKKKKSNKILERELDLHGYTVKESVSVLDTFIEKAFSKGYKELRLRVVTGKGIHSGANGAVLAYEIPLHLETKWAKRILFMEESPASVLINGLPIRGDFLVVLSLEEDV